MQVLNGKQALRKRKKFYKFLKDEMGVTKVRFPESSSFGVKPVSREGTERLVRAACQYALDHHRPPSRWFTREI